MSRVAYRLDLTADRLRETLRYDPGTGEFSWVHLGGRKTARVGCVNKAGYLRISVDGTLHYAHRLAWLYMTGSWPLAQVDHRDLNKGNNRWENLREANASTNGFNVKTKKNESGFKGVSLCKPNGRFYARIVAGGRKFHLGHYATAEEAHAAYREAAAVHHGEYARLA